MADTEKQQSESSEPSKAVQKEVIGKFINSPTNYCN